MRADKDRGRLSSTRAARGSGGDRTAHRASRRSLADEASISLAALTRLATAPPPPPSSHLRPRHHIARRLPRSALSAISRFQRLNDSTPPQPPSPTTPPTPPPARGSLSAISRYQRLSESTPPQPPPPTTPPDPTCSRNPPSAISRFRHLSDSLSYTDRPRPLLSRPGFRRKAPALRCTPARRAARI